jgi:ribose/xylose/arabinose/galactoside ABC-type transport system permease subunit
MKYWIALRLIRLGWWMLAPGTRDEVLRLVGIAGRKHII